MKDSDSFPLTFSNGLYIFIEDDWGESKPGSDCVRLDKSLIFPIHTFFTDSDHEDSPGSESEEEDEEAESSSDEEVRLFPGLVTLYLSAKQFLNKFKHCFAWSKLHGIQIGSF